METVHTRHTTLRPDAFDVQVATAVLKLLWGAYRSRCSIDSRRGVLI